MVDGRKLNGDATDREASFGPFHLMPARQVLLCGGNLSSKVVSHNTHVLSFENH